MTPLEVAVTQIGVKENPAGSNKVKYNTWFYGREVSGSSYPWCMACVEWCFNEAGTPLPIKTASCPTLYNWYKKNRPWCIVNDPRPGDIVLYTFHTKPNADHVGIIESVQKEFIISIEGNTSLSSNDNGGAVMRRTRGKGFVYAYIRPFKPEKEEEPDLTKAEVLKIIEEYEEKRNPTYADLKNVPEYWKSDVQQLLAADAIDGGTDKAIDPTDINLTKETLKAVVIAMRYFNAEIYAALKEAGVI